MSRGIRQTCLVPCCRCRERPLADASCRPAGCISFNRYAQLLRSPLAAAPPRVFCIGARHNCRETLKSKRRASVPHLGSFESHPSADMKTEPTGELQRIINVSHLRIEIEKTGIKEQKLPLFSFLNPNMSHLVIHFDLTKGRR